MRIFVNKLMLISAVVFALLALNYTANEFFIRDINIVPSQCKVLAIGNSQIKAAVNPELVDGCLNVSHNAKTYLETYLELSQILPKNESIEYVITNFSNFVIMNNHDRMIKDAEWLKRLAPIIKWQDLATHNISKKRYLKLLVQNMMLYPNLSLNDDYMDAFKKDTTILSDRKKNNFIKKKLTIYIKDGTLDCCSSININYLDSIIYLTKKHNVKLILLNPPVHKVFENTTPEVVTAQFNLLIKKYEERGISILELDQNKMEKDYWADFVHVNYEGSLVVSRYIQKEIEKN